MRWGRPRKALVGRPTFQKVSTTVLTSSLGLWLLRGPGPNECAAAVAPATPSPVSPTPAVVRARVACSAATPTPVRRPAADARRASGCPRGSPALLAASDPA